MEVNGKVRDGMAYLMNYKGIAPPTAQYYNGIKKGYEDNGMDPKYLHDALLRSVEYQQAEVLEHEEFMEDELQISLE